MEIGFGTHLDPLKGGKCHGLRGVTVLIYDVFPKRAVIKAYSDGPVILLALLYELPEQLPGLGVVRMEIPGIDADFLHNGNNRHGNFRGKMDIGHKGSVYAL